MTQAEIDRYRPERDLLYGYECEQVRIKAGFLRWDEVYGEFPDKIPPPYIADSTQLKCAALCFMNESGFSNSTAYYDFLLSKVTNNDMVKLFGHIVDIQIQRAMRQT